jgi:D-alanyl-D-alanine carboxypeptidase
MRKAGKILFVLLFLGFLGTSLLIVFRPYFTASGQKQAILSPIPNFLTLLVNGQVSTLNLWLPLLNNMVASDLKKPEIEAKSALLYDLTTKKVLYAKNPKEKLPMASLTKIMTAVIALENKKADDKYIVKPEDLVGEDTM